MSPYYEDPDRICWAWGLLLADGEDPGLVDCSQIMDQPASKAECRKPSRYLVDLDESVYAGTGWAALCVEHTAIIRRLPHGGVLRVRDEVIA